MYSPFHTLQGQDQHCVKAKQLFIPHLTSVQCANGSTAIGHQGFQNIVGDFIIGAVVCLSIVWEAIFSAFRLRFLDSLDYTRSVEFLLLFGLRVLRRSRNLFSAKKCFIYVVDSFPIGSEELSVI